jgi:hypothetical protein
MSKHPPVPVQGDAELPLSGWRVVEKFLCHSQPRHSSSSQAISLVVILTELAQLLLIRKMKHLCSQLYTVANKGVLFFLLIASAT